MAARVSYLLVSAMLVAVANASVIKRGTVAPPEERDVRIVDGNQAGVGQFPHQASVIADGTAVCAGSLITSAAVLTTAHCTEGRKRWSIRLGGIHRTAAETTAWIVESISAAVHPEYDAWYASYNVAVLLLPTEAPLNRFINVVALPSFSEVNDTFAGQTALVSGWGLIGSNEACCPELLQWTDVTVLSNEICSEFYSAGTIIESTLCAANEKTGICNGDFGSALVLETKEGFKQIGVASFVPTTGCDAAGTPAGYTRVTSVLDWITETAGISVE